MARKYTLNYMIQTNGETAKMKMKMKMKMKTDDEYKLTQRYK